MLAETALLDGRKVHYSSHGSAKEALVLVHGWTCDETAWSANVPELSKHYRVLTLDLPGHGQSDLAPSYTMESFADSVAAIMSHAKVERAVVAGYSMGGPVILAFARRHPQQALALVGVDAAFFDPAAAEKGKSNDFAVHLEGPGGPAAR